MTTPVKTALVTGASEGIGFATATLLLAEGHRVAIAARSAAGLAAAMSRLDAGDPDRLMAIEMRIGDEGSMANGIHRLAERWGNADILVNNAGLVAPATPFGEGTAAVLRESLEVNLFGAVYLCARLLPGMRARGWGRIVNVASTAGIGAPLRQVSHSTSKAALIAFTRVLAVETTGDGVCVNAVAPGPVATRNYQAAKGDAAMRKRARAIPAGRLATPEDIAGVIAFLASPAAAHLSGQVIAVDGAEQAAGPYTPMVADSRLA